MKVEFIKERDKLGFNMRRVYERDEKGRRYYQLDEELETVASPFIRTDRAWTTVITTPIDMTDADSFRKKRAEFTSASLL